MSTNGWWNTFVWTNYDIQFKQYQLFDDLTFIQHTLGFKLGNYYKSIISLHKPQNRRIGEVITVIQVESTELPANAISGLEQWAGCLLVRVFCFLIILSRLSLQACSQSGGLSGQEEGLASLHGYLCGHHPTENHVYHTAVGMLSRGEGNSCQHLMIPFSMLNSTTAHSQGIPWSVMQREVNIQQQKMSSVLILSFVFTTAWNKNI
jgi:hypothetical protein